MNEAQEHSGKAAFEINKGPRQVMTLSEQEVEKYLDLRELIDALEDGFRASSWERSSLLRDHNFQFRGRVSV